MNVTVEQAVNALQKAMKDEGTDSGTLAHGWHCNIAMACYDSIKDMSHDDAHKLANEAATRFMKHCFDVDTKA